MRNASSLRMLVPVLGLLMLLSSVPSRAQGGPADACKRFWVAVNTGEYGTAWSLLSLGSRNRVIDMVCKSEKLDRAEVQRMFDGNDPRVQNGFWKSFRESSKADALASLNWESGPIEGNQCIVRATSPESGKELSLKMFHENGLWRFGLLETYNPH